MELLFCAGFCKRRTWVAFALLIAGVLAATTLGTENGAVSKAIWSTGSGYILHNSRKPKAIMPQTAVIEVKAVGLNPADWKVVNNLASIPFLRWFVPQAPGYDLSGVVVSASPTCTSVKVGDRVFGQGLGVLQQYAVGYCPHLGKLPDSVSFVQGAAAPTVSYTALVGLRKLKEKDSVLIVGASGGCGLAGIALSKARNVAKIYCVASAKNREEVMSRGCDGFYDYTAPDFKSKIVTDLKGKIDIVYDTVTELIHIPSMYVDLLMPTLKASGQYVALNPSLDALKAENFKKFHTFLAAPDRSEVDFVSRTPSLFTELKVALVMDGLNVSNVYRAYDQLKSHRTVGKIVLTVGESA